MSLRHKGFTIIELVVVALIFSVIMVITSALYFRGRDAVELSSDKIDTAGRSRRAIDELTPIVAGAVEVGGFEALEVFDPTPLDMTDACHFDITSREDFLDPNYDPQSDFEVFGPYHRFRVLYDPARQEVRLVKLLLVPVEIDTTVNPRQIARNVSGCRLEPVSVGSVSITMEIRADEVDQRRPGGVTTSTLHAILVSPGSK